MSLVSLDSSPLSQTTFITFFLLGLLILTYFYVYKQMIYSVLKYTYIFLLYICVKIYIYICVNIYIYICVNICIYIYIFFSPVKKPTRPNFRGIDVTAIKAELNSATKEDTFKRENQYKEALVHFQCPLIGKRSLLPIL